MTEQTDEQLVKRCLDGNQDAWVALVRRYRQLVYTVIRSYRLSDSDSADVFQTVCVELFSNLSRLRNTGSLRRWLIIVTGRASFRCKRSAQSQRFESGLDLDSVAGDLTGPAIADLEDGQILREAIETLPHRCAEMIRLLFLTDPPLPYAEVAARLGLAEGSIGFIRRRCLDKLKAALERRGF